MAMSITPRDVLKFIRRDYEGALRTLNDLEATEVQFPGHYALAERRAQRAKMELRLRQISAVLSDAPDTPRGPALDLRGDVQK